MASAVIFSSLRRRRSPYLESFVAPVDLPNDGVLEVLRSLCKDLMCSFSCEVKKAPFFLGENCRSLIRRIEVISTLVDEFYDMGSSRLGETTCLCFKELYLVLYRSKILIDYVVRSSKLWLLIQIHAISGHFHDIGQQLSTLLDVIPLGGEVSSLSDDVREQIELLRTHSSKSRLSAVGERDNSLRLRLYGFLNEFESGNVPAMGDLYSFFVKELKVLDVKGCRAEIEFLEEHIVNDDGDAEPTASVINGFVALMRYCRFLLFRFEDEEDESGKWMHKKADKGLIAQEIRNTFISVPKDFCCPISLDLMKDPVMVSTGQTYDRVSILRWIEEGHTTCPKTGQSISYTTKLVPNRALRNLILQWCIANGTPYDPPENPDYYSENPRSSPSKAVMEANRATTALLVEQLDIGTPRAKNAAAREIRLLAKTGRENRSCIADAGAIPLLNRLLSSSDPFLQENSVTAMLNLSIFDKNKSRIMEVQGCLSSIVDVLRHGHTTEARENAAATLFSLSAVHEFKKQIASEQGAVEALSRLLREGTPRGQRDAVTGLFNLSTHTENCARMIESGAVMALIEALSCESVCEESARALALIVRQPLGAEAVAKEESAIEGLIGMMRCGTPKGKENSVAALLELCRTGGSTATAKVVKAPALAGLLQSLLFTGTKRARRKAASLARVFQRCENSSNGTSLHYGMGYVAMPVSISVPVL